jgi:hypothetical protein
MPTSSSSSSSFQEEQRELAAKWMESSNILVVVRCRPMSDNEKRGKEEDVVKVIDGQQMIIHDPGHTAVNEMRKARIRDRHFAFDHAFGQTTPSDKVYNNTTRFLVDGVVAGFNATVFAYGATGSGKTFTMLGAPQTPGLMVLTLRDLYKEIDRAQVASTAAVEAYEAEIKLNLKKKGANVLKRIEYKVSLSYVEVYNENIRDLLSESGDSQEFLDLREDPFRGNCVAGVSEHSVSNTNDIMSLLSAGNKRRTQEPTAANKESSRSHAVLQIHVSQHPVKSRDELDDPFAGFRNGKNNQNKVKYEGVRKSMGLGGGGVNGVNAVIKVGKFSLIDLAGSERAANTHNRGLRLLEGANINRSLLALGNCITALVQGNGSFVPYRDSKLTRLLKDSLGGNCRTVMISCISPAAASFEETCNTLKYANRAKNIRTNITEAALNKVDVRVHAAEYESLISGLRNEVATLKHKLAATGGLMNATLAATLGVGGFLGVPGGGFVSPSAAVQHQVRMTDAQPSLSSSSDALSSPALKKTGMRSISPIQSPRRGVGGRGGGEDVVESSQSSLSPQSPGGFQANHFESRSPRVAVISNTGFSIPEGYILINQAEAAAAAERLRILRDELVTNFQERMQIQRSLIELHAQTVQNDAEIGRRQVAVARYEQSQKDLESTVIDLGRTSSLSPFSPSSKALVATQSAATAARKEIIELENSIQANTRTKNHLLSRLKECTDQAEAIRTQLDSQCNTDERRELLALEYRVCLLELDKVELEQSSLLRIHEADAQRVEIRKLKLALKARDRLLLAQSDLIKKHGLTVDVLYPDKSVDGVLRGPTAGLAAVDEELSVYKSFESDVDDGDEGEENSWVDVHAQIDEVVESKESEGDGKRNNDKDDDENHNEDESNGDHVTSSPPHYSSSSARILGDVSFVEGTAEWMDAHFIANPKHSSSATPSKMSTKLTQPRSPANPPPAPSLEFKSAGTTHGTLNHQVNSTNPSQSNLQQNIPSVTSPPKATSWLERAVQLVRGVKSQKNTSQQRDDRHEGDQGNRVSLGPILVQQRQEVQVPLRPLRLQSLSRNKSSEHMVTPQNDSLDTLLGPQVPLRDPFGQEIISKAGRAKISALQAVEKPAAGHEILPPNSVSGLQKPRIHVSDTDLVHGSVSNDESSLPRRKNLLSSSVSSSYLPISTTEIRAALVLAEARTASAESSAAESVAALQRRDILLKRNSNERLIPIQREEMRIEDESKQEEVKFSHQRRNNHRALQSVHNNQDEEDEGDDEGLLYVPKVQQLKYNTSSSSSSSALPPSRRSLSDGVTQGNEGRVQKQHQQLPLSRKEPVWLSAIPPHRPPVSNALKMARAAEAREKRENIAHVSSFDTAPSQATSLNHAIAAYSAPKAPSRKSQIIASGIQRQPAAPRAIRDPDERAL